MCHRETPNGQNGPKNFPLYFSWIEIAKANPKTSYEEQHKQPKRKLGKTHQTEINQNDWANRTIYRTERMEGTFFLLPQSRDGLTELTSMENWCGCLHVAVLKY